MEEFEKINIEICKKRQHMQELIENKDNLLDPEVISASQLLDDILNDYNKLLEKIKK